MMSVSLGPPPQGRRRANADGSGTSTQQPALDLKDRAPGPVGSQRHAPAAAEVAVNGGGSQQRQTGKRGTKAKRAGKGQRRQQQQKQKKQQKQQKQQQKKPKKKQQPRHSKGQGRARGKQNGT